jgi:GNAT superfamily N-acetyltransferase
MVKLVGVRNIKFVSDLEKIVELSAENLLWNKSMFSDYENLGDEYKKDIFLGIDYLAYGDSRAVAFSSGCVAVDDSGNRDYEIKSLFVTPQYQGLGIGSELLHNSCVRALNLSCRNIVFSGNRRFLQSNGFSFGFNTGRLEKGVYSNLIEHKLD